MKNSLIKQQKNLIFSVVLLLLGSILFLPKLGQTPLRSWDEAWYPEIARNVLKKNDFFLLEWLTLL